MALCGPTGHMLLVWLPWPRDPVVEPLPHSPTDETTSVLWFLFA
ncbi:similar to RIKEN cDNA 3010027G13, isoform CRA_d [Rattus norvegicus]|uniref:Uncharacterized protein n=1 Tax=Rattus norvegicus TaxID=10116 RepID=A6HJJ3_RAT|nr:similar to RIKEN cDNA 3010027G13, isoform CRA_d [Rattus norvegicus]